MTLSEQFEALDQGIIDEYVEEGQEENLHLDFKLTNGSDLGYRPDRKNFAKAASGFANSSGGIIIWGVEADEKNEEGVDCASGKQELDNINQFVSKLNEYTGDAVSPVVEGILHKAIETENGQGFAASLIPESISGPHMAKLGEDRYYKRSGDSFYKMEHFDIADMFGRRRRPELSLRVEPASIRDRGRRQSLLQLLLSIENTGRGTAKAPFLAIRLPEDASVSSYGVDGNRNHGLPRLRRHSGGDNEYHFGSNQGVVIHPGSLIQVTKVDVQYPKKVIEIDHVDIQYSVAAEGVRMVSSSARVSQADIYGFLED
jgi:hypothetical protein